MNGSLYLFPSDPDRVCDPGAIQTTLLALEVIGAPLPGDAAADLFSAGGRFARHVVFAGCSPYLRFEPEHPNDCDFCHVALHGPFEQPHLVTGTNVKPRCPHCRARLADWRERVEKEAPLACSGCGKPLRAIDMDWRQHAATGRVLVEIRNVFPGEASPSDRLMGELEAGSGLPWRYAWAARLSD